MARNPRWAPGVVAVAASISALLLIAIARHAANAPDDGDDNRSSSGMHNATNTPDSEPDDDHNSRDDAIGNGEGAPENLGEGESEGIFREDIDDEEEYVVVTDAEVCYCCVTATATLLLLASCWCLHTYQVPYTYQVGINSSQKSSPWSQERPQ